MSLWSRLTARFTRAPATPELYTPAERAIYKFWDGTKWVHADPMILHHRVMEQWGDLSAHIIVAGTIGTNVETKSAAKEDDKMVAHFRRIFGVKEPAEGLDCAATLTRDELCALFDDFWDYCNSRVKKNLSPSATSSAATPPASPPSSDASQPTPSTSDCGSTATAPSTATPTPSGSGSSSPSARPEPPPATGSRSATDPATPC